MSDRSEKRVLFVSYLFPPTGGGGVQRASKFVKFLPHYGWNCSVLTVSNSPVPLRDEQLERDIPPETVIRRCRTLEPGCGLKPDDSGSSPERGPLAWCRRAARRATAALLQPDPQVLWRPFAVRTGLRLLRQVRHDAVIATGPPFSSLLVGAALSRGTGLPLVLDYRDEWDISNDNREDSAPGRWGMRMQRRMQRAAVRRACVLLATTPSSALHLAQTADQCGSHAQATWIYNGFDEDDFPVAGSLSQRADYGNGTRLFRMSFAGTLWNLSPIEPFVAGVRKLARERPELASRLELVVAGRRTEAQERELDRLSSLPCKLVRLPYVSHREAIRIMRESDAQLLLNADRPDAHRIVNAKTFEYMAARRPIFTVAPDGDLWDIVRNLPGTVLCQPRAAGAIAEALARSIERHAAGFRETSEDQDISQYERRHLAGELAVLLDETVHTAAGHSGNRPPRELPGRVGSAT